MHLKPFATASAQTSPRNLYQQDIQMVAYLTEKTHHISAHKSSQIDPYQLCTTVRGLSLDGKLLKVSSLQKQNPHTMSSIKKKK